MRKIQKLTDVVVWRLCLGCGACAFVCPESNIELINYEKEGIRPKVKGNNCKTCTECLKVCPAVEIDSTSFLGESDLNLDMQSSYGPVIEIWEGHACDPEIRFSGSSGGILTALSLYCLEKERMHGVLHIGQDSKQPLINRTWISQSRADLLTRTGSRYAPASACDSLALVETAPAPCVFIGQPSEVAALRKAEQIRPALKKNIGVALSFFCAGSPPTLATIELLRKLGLKPEEITDLRYRGKGWPGMFTVTEKGKSLPIKSITYKESWAFLQKFRPYSVHLWPDGTGEMADIACGDAWHREPQLGDAGSSLIIVRTHKGRKILRDAMAAGYLQLQPATLEMLGKATFGLIEKKRTIWGRQFAMRLFGIPTTNYRGMPLFELWLELSMKEKLKSILGTIRRIIKRKYYQQHSSEIRE